MKRKRILIIEDDHDIRDIVAYVLSNVGFDLVVCDSLEPLSEISRCRPDLILLDEWINQKEGTMLCKEIKKVHELIGIPIVITSTSMEIAQIAVECQADGFVSKPFDLDALIQEIKKCLPEAYHASVGHNFN